MLAMVMVVMVVVVGVMVMVMVSFLLSAISHLARIVGVGDGDGGDGEFPLNFSEGCRRLSPIWRALFSISGVGAKLFLLPISGCEHLYSIANRQKNPF